MTTVKNKKYLSVYLRGQYAGKLCAENATLSFSYDPAYLRIQDAAKLSGALPLQLETFDHQITSAFFSGLLPEGDVRRKLAKYLGLSAENTFALLEKIGGECAGAVSVYPENIPPSSNTQPTYRILDKQEAMAIFSLLDKRPLMVGEDDVRISGAGAQNKLMIAFVKDHIAIPTGNTPSTHIIKPPIKDIEHSVHNEFFCMRLASASGLPVPDTRILWLGNTPYYVVERYDRLKKSDGLVMRLHQEDFCQALHIAPENKYEREGGPGLAQCFSLLDQRIATGFMAGKNKITLLHGVIFNFLIGNGDAHGKNFSLLYEDDGSGERLAPFYDLLCTNIYSDAKMAMKLDGHYKFSEISPRHFVHLAEECGFRTDFVEKQVRLMVDLVTKAAKHLSDKHNQKKETASPVYAEIVAVIEKHCRQIST